MESIELKSSPSCSKSSGWGARHTLTVLGFWGFTLSYAMRFNLSIAIVAMVNTSQSTQETQLPVFKVDECYHTKYSGNYEEKTEHILLQFDDDNATTNSKYPNKKPDTYGKILLGKDSSVFERSSSNASLINTEGEFNWNEKTQGVILGSFFWGYVVTQIPGGYLGHKFGGKWPFGIGLLVTAAFSLLIPLCARLGEEFLICARVIQGLGEGVTMPAMHSLLAKWIPVEERSRLAAAVYAGMSLGTAMVTATSGYIIHYFGWPVVFYICGGVTIIWFIFWIFCVFDSPGEHPRISANELHHIRSSLCESCVNGNGNDDKSKAKPATPWREIITSMPFWAILICQTMSTWGIYTLLHEIPSYMKNVLHFNLTENALLSAFPHILAWMVTILVTHCGDWLIERNFMSVVSVRKSSNTIALWGTAAAMIGIAYSGCDRTATVTLITLAIGAYGAIVGGVLINLIDIAPNYASILMGIVNTFATFSGFAAPWLAGFILNGNSSLETWRRVFLIAAAICFSGNLIYILMASGKEQKWNRVNSDYNTPTSSENIIELQINQFVIDRELVLEEIPHFVRSTA